MYVDDVKLAGNTENIEPTWTILMEDVHLENQHIGVALIESVKLVTTLWQTAEMCSNPGFRPEQKKNNRPELQGHLMPKRYLHSPMTWKVMQRSVERYCELANKTTQQFSKSQRHALTTINPKKKKWDRLENCEKLCSQIVLKCLDFARIGKPDILWSVNKYCDKRLARDLGHSSYK